MEKFISLDFAFVLVWCFALFIVHEYGHYLAFYILGIPAKMRRSILVPGIDPKETVSVKRWKGLLIALGGFVLSLIVVLTSYLFKYKHYYLILMGAFVGSIFDFAWAFSMLGSKTITLNSRE